MFDPRRTTSSDDRFIELALCYLDGRSSAEQLSQLNAELAADGFKRELFVDTCLHGKLLSELLGNSLSEAPAESARSPILGFLGDSMQQGINLFSNQTFLSLLIAAVAISSMLGVLAILPAPIYEQSRSNHVCTTTDDDSTTNSPGRQPRDKDGKLKLVARITGKHNCRWSPEGRAPYSYDHLGLGRVLKLDAGLVEITYYNGAKLVLEGPVEFTVEKPNACRLDLGKLTANVSKKAVGFTVKTPTAEIVDLGTEFGVEVAKDRLTDIHVFQGIVEAELFAQSGATSKKLRLTNGQAVRLGPGGSVTNITADAKRFVYAVSASRMWSVLHDDFDDGVLDPAKWTTVTDGIPPGGAEVREESGVLKLINRGHLVTVGQYDPVALGGVRITGLWIPVRTTGGPENYDALEILTRSDGVPVGNAGETRNGIEFLAIFRLGASHPLGIWPQGSNLSIGKVASSGRIAFNRPGQVFMFEVIDDGSNLSFTVTQVGNASNTASATATVASDTFDLNHVVLHNHRRRAEGSRESHVDNVRIHLLNPPIEAGAANRRKTPLITGCVLTDVFLF